MLPNKHTDWAHYKTVTEGMYWPDGQVLPSFSRIDGELDAITLGCYNDDVKVTLAGLQGMVNRKKTRIYLNGTNGRQEGSNTWPERLGLKRRDMNDLFAFVKKYAGEVDGVVLYSARNPHFRNLASTAANIHNAIPMEQSLYDTFNDRGIELPVVLALTKVYAKTSVEVYTYLYENFWKDCSRRVFVSLSPVGHTSFVRDMAAAVGSAVVWLDARIEEEKVMLDKFLCELKAGESIILGWWPEERSGIGSGTRYGVSTIPSDFYENSTVHASLSHVMHIPPVPKKPELENKIYLSFFMSDGDNVQYCQHQMSVLWGNKSRGQVPLNWTVSPGLADIGPGLLNYYFDTATTNDCFSSGPSGLGYALIYDEHNKVLNLTDEDKTDAYTKFSNQYLTKNGMRVITVWDQLREMHYKYYEKNCRALYGVTLEDWFQNPKPLELHVENHRLPFMPNRPAYAENTDDMYKMLEKTIREYDGKKPLFLAAQGVTWSLSPENIEKLAERFDKLQPGKIEVLRADHFFTLLNEANGDPFNLALSKKVSVKVNDKTSADVIFSGSTYGDNVWTADSAGSRTFDIYLGGTYRISRYVLKHAGVNEENSDKNNRDFTVSASTDGENWTVLDERHDCRDDITDVDVSKTAAKYVRLTVSKGGDDGVVRIADMELYGEI